ncbi:MAG: MOSC domain-containing protein [Actinomycetota bacterium]
MRVDALWQYPVKTMMGIEVPSVDLASVGIIGDRTWAVRDLERGTIANSRSHGGLMQYAAVPAGPAAATIVFPDGTTIRTDDPAIHERLSNAMQTPVALQSLASADDLDFYRHPPADPALDLMEYLRTIFGREGDEPLPDFSKFAPEVMEYETPPGTFYDCYPLMLMTTSALRSIQTALPDSVIDVRRFRPSIVVDTGDLDGHPEFEWTGRHFAIGTAVIEVKNDCPRCASLTKELAPDIPADRAILRHVVRDLGQAVGVYCTVVTPGTIAVGDELRPI